MQSMNFNFNEDSWSWKLSSLASTLFLIPTSYNKPEFIVIVLPYEVRSRGLCGAETVMLVGLDVCSSGASDSSLKVGSCGVRCTLGSTNARPDDSAGKASHIL